MSFLTTSAVVIRTFSLGESDRIITLLTRDAGIVRAIAKGAAKSRKRFGGVFLTGTHINVRIFLKKKTTLHRLDAADIIEPYVAFNQEPALFAAASHLLELSSLYSMEGSGEPRQFALLTSTLRALCNLGLQERLLRIFELRTMAYAGVAPNFDLCVDCGDVPDPDDPACFSVKDGGVRCGNCGKDPSLVELPPGPRRLFSDIITAESKILPRLAFRPMDLVVAKRTIPPFCEFNLGRKLRSLRMLRKLLDERKSRYGNR